MMEHLEIILPLTILALAFILKLAIDRDVKVPNLLQAMCELPVDIIFLSISFLIGYTISKPKDPSEGLFYTIAFIVLAVVIVILWRKCLKLLENKNKWWIVIFCINLILSSLTLLQSTSIILKVDKIGQTETIESKTDNNEH